ncbi:NYN domain-containing protein [Luteimonas sp. SJ-92]|uniref:NYN domain-containing protein n=1 Tax=Luteimonas salinisoli TaxID=2752307 RepID=A0A853J9B2_9GAMM|nr:NYN domain-containing protein [Luteimonas salinisoli]NZA25278.1 NYN domain-containing protein [Luteimonas salinisoli]
MADTELRIALLIDADNAPSGKIEPILTELARHGVANVRRAYGNWKNPHLKGWEEALHAYAIRPIQQFAYTSGKNASDMAMVIDAMDLLYARTLDGFAIVSSDADFTPLVMRLRNENMRVFGFGQEKTPLPFVKACSTFLYVEKLGASDEEDTSRVVRPKRSEDLLRDANLVHLLRNAVSATADDSGWSHLGVVGSHIRNQTSFDERNYGYRNLSALIEATGLFELRREGQMVEIREKPKAKPKSRSRARKKAVA